MARQYMIPMSNASVTSTNTLVAFCPSANSPSIEVLRAWASQSANATSAQQRVKLCTQFAAAAANQVVGTGQAPIGTEGNDPLSFYYSSSVCGPTTGTGTTGSATINCTSDGNGVKQILYPDNFNVLNGWLWVPTPPETHKLGALSSTKSYGLAFDSTPGTLTNWSAGLSYRELG